MILFDIVGDNEHHPIYQRLTIENGNRQYDFLRSIVGVALDVERPFLSSQVLKALNFHAIGCLHSHAGEYRPCQVQVGKHMPPPFYRVHSLMDDFVNLVNRLFVETDPVTLAALVLWRLNYIHPFINGNGRTARAACYFVLCVKAGQWLPGTTILPELIRGERARYEAGLQCADKSFDSGGSVNLSELQTLLQDLLDLQLNSTSSSASHAPAPTQPQAAVNAGVGGPPQPGPNPGPAPPPPIQS